MTILTVATIDNDTQVTCQQYDMSCQDQLKQFNDTFEFENDNIFNHRLTKGIRKFIHDGKTVYVAENVCNLAITIQHDTKVSYH